MAAETYFLTGKVKWAKLKNPDSYKDDQFYTMDFYPDKKSKGLIKASGSKLKENTDKETGEIFYRLRRKTQQLSAKGEIKQYGPPAVRIATGEVNAEGVPVSIPFDGLIGNGSKLTAKIEVYDSANGKGTRLEGVRIDELVEYNPDFMVKEVTNPTAELPF